MSITIKTGSYTAYCAKVSDDHAIYILYPLDTIDKWVDKASAQYGASIIAVTGMDWDNDLTPWSAPGVPDGSEPFAGHAAQFLDTLTNEIIPGAESRMGLAVTRRDLVGVSLSGLFTVWQWALCGTFANIASLSGSFWYEGFTSWLKGHFPPRAGARAYFSLGSLEGRSRVPQFKTIPQDTVTVVDILKRAGVDTVFETVPGNHYQHGEQRLGKVLAFLTANATTQG